MEKIMTCFFCNGNLVAGTTTHTSDIGERAVIVRGVPCLKCDQCLEISYTGKVYENLESVLNALKKTSLDVAIATYVDEVA
ncbi:MAG: YgiT-type zinc finger protein [Defluviitaleaceae bacterium]|nr:YgiT-type zinc finger protein [Defluviitaleaceae bacterium]